MSGKSGKVAGSENVVAFERFIKARKRDGDWGPFILPGGRGLNKSAIVKSSECGFGKSVFIQNPQVRSRLMRLEAELVAEGILAADDWNSAGAAGMTPNEALTTLEKQISDLGSRFMELEKFIGEVNTITAEYEAEASVIIKSRALTSNRSR